MKQVSHETFFIYQQHFSKTFKDWSHRKKSFLFIAVFTSNFKLKKNVTSGQSPPYPVISTRVTAEWKISAKTASLKHDAWATLLQRFKTCRFSKNQQRKIFKEVQKQIPHFVRSKWPFSNLIWKLTSRLLINKKTPSPPIPNTKNTTEPTPSFLLSPYST